MARFGAGRLGQATAIAPPAPPPVHPLRLTSLGGFPLGKAPLGYGELPSGPASPVVFVLELADWLGERLGVPVYPGHIPQGLAADAVLRYSIIDGDSIYGLSGPAGLSSRNVQFDLFSPDYAETATLEVALRSLLSGYRGKIGRARCQGAFLVRTLSDYSETATGDDEGKYRSMSEFKFYVAD